MDVGIDMDDGISNFNETEGFEDYNPHPYQGGYDIAATYGDPLPPTPTICYPISGASSYPLPPSQMPLPLIPSDPPVAGEPAPSSPDAGERAISAPSGREDELPEAEHGSFYDYSSVEWWWNLYGLPPFMMGEDGNGLSGWRCDAEDLRYWSRFRRAMEYIFGYSQGFGERRIGVDSYGIPIYANKRNGSDTVNVEIEPAITGKLDYHSDSLHSENWSLSYNNREDESHRFSNWTHSYTKHHSEGSFHDEAAWEHSHHGFYDEDVYPEREWLMANLPIEAPSAFPLSYDGLVDEVNLHGNQELAYDSNYYGGAQSIYLEPVESSFQRVSYQEVSHEFSFTDSNREPSYNKHGDESNIYINTDHDYERRDYQRTGHVELEPYKPTWAQYPGYYGIPEEELYIGSEPISYSPAVFHESSSPRSTWQISPFGELGDEDKFVSSEYAHQSHHENHSLVELEPFKPTWVLNPNYYEAYEDISAQGRQVNGEGTSDNLTGL